MGATSAENRDADLDCMVANERQLRVFEALLSSIKDFAYIFDRQGRFTYANKGLLDLWGLKLEEAVGKNFYDLNYEPSLAARLQRQIKLVFETGQGLSDETVYVSPSGVSGYYEYIFAPVFGADGSVEAVAGSTRDITERKRAEVERERLLESERRARAEADMANRAKDRFLAVLSHELRTPLTPVALITSAMESDPLLPEEFREDIAMVRRNVELETRLIDDLLDLSRIVMGKFKLNRRPTSLHGAIDDVLRTVAADLGEKRLIVRHELSAESDLVLGDAARLQQVIWNLLKNAAKFTPEAGRVSISTRNEAGRVVLAVSDTGRGIPAEMLPRIFDAFEQGEPGVTARFGGLGLGLAIAKAVVDLHGGTITAASAGPGMGATFTVSLPLHAAVDAIPADQRAPEETRGSTRGLRLLLVEDHPDTARMLTRLLELDGINVCWAATKEEALKQSATAEFDVIVSDLGLPDGSAMDLLRQMANTRPPAAIAMSGYGMEEDVRQSREAGFMEHLVKPVDVLQLRQAIRRAVGNMGGEHLSSGTVEKRRL